MPSCLKKKRTRLRLQGLLVEQGSCTDMPVCAHAQIHLQIQAPECTRGHVHTLTQTSLHVHTHRYTCRLKHQYAREDTFTLTSTDIHNVAHTHVCNTPIHVCTHMHRHTLTHACRHICEMCVHTLLHKQAQGCVYIAYSLARTLTRMCTLTHAHTRSRTRQTRLAPIKGGPASKG